MRRTSGVGLVGALIAGWCVGCGGPSAHDATTVTQSGDTTIVVPALDGPTGRLVSDLVLGADDTNPDAIFGSVSDVAMAPDGRIYVLESRAQIVHVYSSEGVALDRLTRHGDGPGEIRSARELAVTDEGVVLVREVGRDIERFGADGRYLNTWSFAWGSEPDMRIAANGDLLIYRGRDIPVDGAPWEVSGEEVYSMGTARAPTGGSSGTFVRLSPAGDEVATAESVVLDTDVPCLLNPQNPSALIYCIGFSLQSGPWLAIDADGALWSGDTSAYRLDRSPGLSGTNLPLVSIRPGRERLAISAGLRDALDGYIREQFGPIEGFHETYPLPTMKPAIARVFPTRAGTLWVRLHAPSERTTDAGGEEAWIETESRFDIFTPEGEHVGYVTGPAEMWIQDIRGDTVLATRRGDYGVPYVERFVIAWSDPN